MADPFVDFHQDLSGDAPDDEVLAEALWWEHPPEPYGPDVDYDDECPGPPS